MTYNIKNSWQDYDSWIDRRLALIDQIKSVNPDLIGLQEADENWITYIKETLNEYTIVGLGRDGEDKGEHTPILFKTSRYKLLDTKTFWLSEYQDKSNVGWDGACPRICTLVKLKDIKTKRIFYMYNTHLDHKGKTAREKGLELIIDHIKTSNTPSILTGDFNFIENSKLYKKAIKESLSDSKYLAKDSMSFGTINYFTNFHFKYMPAIDYILLSNDDFQVEKYQVLYQYKHNNKPISDHFPLLVDLKLINSKKR
jgi:endonuclease/exonuclease/phosphatase family metal-dependent hydrolase